MRQLSLQTSWTATRADLNHSEIIQIFEWFLKAKNMPEAKCN